MPQKVKLKARQKQKEEIKIDLEPDFDPADAKDDGLDLNIDASQYRAKKGQCGTRTQATTPPASSE